MIAPSSYGVLSATSANTIQGSRPGFASQSGAKRLGFKIGNTKYSESEGNLSPSSSGVINYLNAGLSLNNFQIMNLTATDFSPTADYADADGDDPHPTAAFTMSPSTYEWIDRTGASIPNSKYNETLGCGNTSLNLPLTLRITLPNVKVKSRYGNPSESIPTSLVQEYKIGTAAGICFAKPNAMIARPNNTWLGWDSNTWTWGWNSGSSTGAGGGKYLFGFDPVNGFKASLNPKFPTTGFPGAEFTLIMTSNASDYTFSSNNSAVEVDTTGKVTLNSKPSGAVTIKAIYKNDTNQVHYYTFDPRTVWVAPNPTLMTYTSAKSACGGESKIPSRAQLTNSPMKTGYEGVFPIPANYYTRIVGEGVLGEWGWVDATSYPGSQWVYNWYWTRDSYSSAYEQFRVFPGTGKVDYSHVSISYYVACLG
ncbi:hypothetical protein RCS94_09785 [Orbaceae bacterium ac157xtp]